MSWGESGLRESPRWQNCADPQNIRIWLSCLKVSEDTGKAGALESLVQSVRESKTGSEWRQARREMGVWMGWHLELNKRR